MCLQKMHLDSPGIKLESPRWAVWDKQPESWHSQTVSLAVKLSNQLRQTLLLNIYCIHSLAKHNYSRTPLIRLIGMARHLDTMKIRIIGFVFENSLHWQLGLQLLIFAVCACVSSFQPCLIWSSKNHNTVLHLIWYMVISRQVSFVGFLQIHPKEQSDLVNWQTGWPASR